MGYRNGHGPLFALCLLASMVASSFAQTSLVPLQTPPAASAADPSGTRSTVVEPTGKAGVQAIVSMRDRQPAAADSKATVSHKKSYSLTLKDGEWTDTGALVNAGETVTFSASGQMTLGDGRQVGPAGLDRGWKDLLRQFPLNSAKAGELVGRVSDLGASVPFAIGASGTVNMPTAGRLYLRTNVSQDLGADGSFKVSFQFANTPSATAKVPSATSAATPIAQELSPATFATIPRRVQDEAGNPGDMVNYALIGTEAQVLAAFKAAGWVTVDKSVGDAVLHGLLSTLGHEAYLEMPMSTLFLFGRAQDLSFARGDPLTVAAERHHLRVWKTGETIDGAPLWVGSATHDIGFEKDQRNGKATHKIDPEIDGERQFLLDSFDAAGAFSSAAYLTPENPLREARTATGGSFHSDGRVLAMRLR